MNLDTRWVNPRMRLRYDRGGRKERFLVLGLLIALACALVEGKGLPAVQFGPDDNGAALYAMHCAACHGTDATGNGPMAPTLKHAPPDLTQLARKNAGTFPTGRVRRVIEGRDVLSHGDRDMPVWGDAFVLRRGASRDVDSARLDAIVRYLETIQLRRAH